MKHRTRPLGTNNVVGRKVQDLRIGLGMKQSDFLAQLQIRGIDIHPSSLSKLEGQTRSVRDRELIAIADILNVSVSDLLK